MAHAHACVHGLICEVLPTQVSSAADGAAAAAAAAAAAGDEAIEDAAGAVGVRDDEARKRRINPRDLARALVSSLVLATGSGDREAATASGGREGVRSQEQGSTQVKLAELEELLSGLEADGFDPEKLTGLKGEIASLRAAADGSAAGGEAMEDDAAAAAKTKDALESAGFVSAMEPSVDAALNAALGAADGGVVTKGKTVEVWTVVQG